MASVRFGSGFYKPKPNRNSVSAHPYSCYFNHVALIKCRCHKYDVIRASVAKMFNTMHLEWFCVYLHRDYTTHQGKSQSMHTFTIIVGTQSFVKTILREMHVVQQVLFLSYATCMNSHPDYMYHVRPVAAPRGGPGKGPRPPLTD